MPCALLDLLNFLPFLLSRAFILHLRIVTALRRFVSRHTLGVLIRIDSGTSLSCEDGLTFWLSLKWQLYHVHSPLGPG